MKTSSEPAWYQASRNVFSGTLGGISVCLVGHPFDTLKVRLQTQPVHNPIYKGVVDCFFKTLKWEGVGGLYKGVGSPIAGQMFFRASYFGIYYQSTSYFSNLGGVHRKRLKLQEYFLCGAITGIFVSFVESPIDLFKSKMQIQVIKEKSGELVGQRYRNVFHCASVIVRNHGILASFQGLQGTIVRNIPSNALFMLSYEMCRSYLAGTGEINQLGPLALLLSGGIGGFMYWCLTYPTDVVKSALMADEVEKSRRRFKGLLHCARSLYKESGWQGFYRGYTPCLMRSLPANAAMLCTVEVARQLYPAWN